jgi:hypothetical protein
MANTGNTCEQCGKRIVEVYRCNSCGMVICLDCLKKTRNRVPPCNCVWDNCNGWIDSAAKPKVSLASEPRYQKAGGLKR